MSYDPAARRDTPLALKLKERIRREGPLRIDQYLEACLYDASHGYYVKQPAIGPRSPGQGGGDFITAPEISQMFGELIGLWSVVVWQQMGEPAPFNLVEFGPGRGTLMRDALRAARVRPQFLSAARVQLIETSTTLREAQRVALDGVGVPVAWPGKLVHAETPELPAIVLANEFVDTEPIEQFVRTADGWVTRGVGLDGRGELAFTELACPDHAAKEVARRFPTARPGDICEVYSFGHDVLDALFNQASRLVAVIIDYGHLETRPGDTLQAVRNHVFEHPLTSPGEADLTAQVDFQQIVGSLAREGYAVDGPVTQAEFLGRLGIIERASKLMAANPAKASEIEIGVARLMSPGGMGGRFKVIGLRSADVPPLPGLELPGRR